MGSKLCSPERIVLGCESCGGRIVFGGPDDLWRSGRITFECGCGRGLTLADRLSEDRPRAAIGHAGGIGRAGPGVARGGR